MIILLLSLICVVLLAGLATTYVWSSNVARRDRSLLMVSLLLGHATTYPLAVGLWSRRRYGVCGCAANSATSVVDHQTDE